MPKGTFWYHSHIGAQRTNGVYGPFIIKERFPPGVMPPTDMIMTVGDWHHEDADAVCIQFHHLFQGYFIFISIPSIGFVSMITGFLYQISAAE